MNVSPTRFRARTWQRGFTMLEMSAALSVTLVLAVALVVMLQQHVQFMQIFKKQSFLAQEAPRIGNVLGRIINQADHYFVYATKGDAISGTAPVLTGGRAIRLFFKTADQQTVQRVIAMESLSGVNQLRFYGWLPDGTATSWTISSFLNDVTFLSEQGILNITLNGPNGEQVCYGGGAK